MKKISKIFVSGMMVIALTVTMVFTVAEIGTVVFNDPLMLEALGSDGGGGGGGGGDTPAPVVVVKKSNTLTASGKTVKFSYKKVKSKNYKIKRANAIKVSKAKGKVSYRKKSGNKKLVVSKNGIITVKKGIKPATYKLKVYVKAAGNSSYKSKTKLVTVTIKILTVENPIVVAGKTVTVSGDDVAVSKVTISRKTAMSVSKAKGTVTYSKKSGSGYFTVNKKTGNITVAAGTPSGTYTIKVKATAAGTSYYKKGTEIATIKITVTEATPPSDDPPTDDQGEDDSVSDPAISE